MLVLRPTANLAGRMGATLVGSTGSSTTLLGDWYANLVNVGSLRLVLAVSERSLLAVVLKARDVASLPAHLSEALREVLGAIGISPQAIEQEITEMNQVLIAKTANRQLLVSMNDFAFMLDVHARHPGTSCVKNR